MSLNSLFTSIFSESSDTALSIGIGAYLICLIIGIALGIWIAWSYAKSAKCSKSFMMTLVVLPTVVAMVIMMVNGNIGTGVAVAGAFSLVRFRSVPGSAREIGAVFISMGTGLALGMGYIGFAIVFAILISLASWLLSTSRFGESHSHTRILSITVPEDLNYTNMFDDLFAHYTKSCTLSTVKTSNMGSLYKLRYELEMIDPQAEKSMIDDLRCRNGNLEVSLSNQSRVSSEL